MSLFKAVINLADQSGREKVWWHIHTNGLSAALRKCQLTVKNCKLANYTWNKNSVIYYDLAGLAT